MERATGIEPASISLEAEVLPLNYTRRTVDRLPARRPEPVASGVLASVRPLSTDAVSWTARSRRAWQTLLITSVSMLLGGDGRHDRQRRAPGHHESFSSSPHATLSWVFTSYNITFAAPAAPRRQARRSLGSQAGVPQRAASSSLVASLLAAMAPSAGVLIGGPRAAGGAAARSSTRRRSRCCCPSSRRRVARWPSGCGAASPGSVAAIAPTLGALLVECAGWRAVFFINLPFVIGRARSPAVACCARRARRRDERFDPVAVPLAAIAVGLLVLAIVAGHAMGLERPADARLLRRRRRAAAVVLHPLVAAIRTRCSTSTCSGCAASPSATSPRRCSSARRSAGSC